MRSAVKQLFRLESITCQTGIFAIRQRYDVSFARTASDVGLSHLLDRLLRQGCIFGISLYHLPELYRPGLTVILAMKSVMVMRR